MERLINFFKKPEPPPLRQKMNEETKDIYPVREMSLCKIYAHVDGLASVWITDKTARLFETEIGLSLDEISKLSERVFNKCVELNFWHGDRVHGILNTQNVDNCESAS